MNITLHIERLVLDGIPVPRTQSGRVRAAVEHELTRLLASGGLARELRSGFTAPSLRGGNMKIAKDSRPDDVGRAIARSVHGEIGNKRTTRKP